MIRTTLTPPVTVRQLLVTARHLRDTALHLQAIHTQRRLATTARRRRSATPPRHPPPMASPDTPPTSTTMTRVRIMDCKTTAQEEGISSSTNNINHLEMVFKAGWKDSRSMERGIQQVK